MMYQMTPTESRSGNFESSAVLEKAIASFNQFGYLKQEGFEVQPCKYFKDRWQVLYNGDYLNCERYTTLKEAMIVYLDFVSSRVSARKPKIVKKERVGI